MCFNTNIYLVLIIRRYLSSHRHSAHPVSLLILHPTPRDTSSVVTKLFTVYHRDTRLLQLYIVTLQKGNAIVLDTNDETNEKKKKKEKRKKTRLTPGKRYEYLEQGKNKEGKAKICNTSCQVYCISDAI